VYLIYPPHVTPIRESRTVWTQQFNKLKEKVVNIAYSIDHVMLLYNGETMFAGCQ